MPSILNTGRDLERLRQIVGVLWRHGFGELITRAGLSNLIPGAKDKNSEYPTHVGARVRLVLQDLGPSFIKLGQIASTRPDLIPQEIIDELKKLQDNVQTESFEEIQKTIETDLGASLAEVYESFEEQPLASASIGQVHRAKMKINDEIIDVAVKVQRNYVRDTVQRDVDLLYWFAHAIERSIPELKIYQPVKMVSEFDRAIMAELDYLQEAENAERFAQNFEHKTDIKFPIVYRQASAKRVLTLEYLDGKKMNDAIASGASGELIARKSIDFIIKQIFEDGFFHADPHPGNIIILGQVDDPVIGLVDLGMVGRLTPLVRDKTIDLMIAAIREDYRAIAEAIYAIGRPTKKIDRRAFEMEMTFLAQKYLGKKLQDIQLAALIRDLGGGAQKYGLEIPTDFLMLGKALMTIEGVGKEIYPELDIFEEIKPYFLKLLQYRYSPERLTQDALHGLMRLSSAASEMPLQIQEILEDLRKGSFRIETREPKLLHTTDLLGQHIFSGLVLMGMIIGTSILFTSKQYVHAGVLLASTILYASGHQLSMAWKRFRDR